MNPCVDLLAEGEGASAAVDLGPVDVARIAAIPRASTRRSGLVQAGGEV